MAFELPEHPGYIDLSKQTSSHEVVLSGRNTEQTQEDYQKQFNELTKLKEEIQVEKAREFSDTEKKALAIIYKGLGDSNPELKRAIENQSLNMIEIPHSEVILISTDGKTVNSIYNSNGEINTEYSKAVSMDLQEAWGKLKEFYEFMLEQENKVKKMDSKFNFNNLPKLLADENEKETLIRNIGKLGGILNGNGSITMGGINYKHGDAEYQKIIERALEKDKWYIMNMLDFLERKKKESLGL